ncbi:MAG: T9SS type A sorting domain-containing protein [Chitinophagales bacterium]
MFQSLHLRFLLTIVICFCLTLTSNTLLQAQCPVNQTQVTLSITTDDYPEETTWELTNWITGAVYASGGSYTTANNTYTQNVCVPNNATIGFTIYDVYQDGICCSFGNGSYSVSEGMTTYASGGNFDASETSLFIIDAQPLDLAIVNMTMPSLLLANTEHTITGRLMNLGTTFVNSFDLNWQVGNGTIHTQTFNIPLFTNTAVDFSHQTTWMPTAGEHTLKVWASNINNTTDDNPENDELQTDFNVLMQLPIRTVLAEHFTNASCGPCAVYNPVFDALMNSNIAHVAPIKYHTSWPGFDPMYQENSADVNPRVSLYGVSGVPNAVLDGGQYAGSPANVNQGTIDFLLNIGSGIIITLDETKTGNTVNIEAEIEALVPINSSNLKVHIVAVEEEVNYSSAPGSNGEKDFPYVMRKMLPNSNGTTIAAMAANTTSTVNVSYTLPNFVDANDMRTIVFVQDQTTGFVYQSFLAPETMGENDNEQSPTIDAPETVACVIDMNITSENASCGVNNGAAMASVSGGSEPFTYQWTNGANTPALSNLGAGTYELVVTDANDCSTTQSITITNTEVPTLEAIAIAPTCDEANGIINIVTNNGTAPFTYQWNTAGIGNSPNASDLTAGNYIVIVTDNVGCTALQNITLSDAGLPNVALTGIEPSCNESGEITASISGGTAPYTLQWNTGETSESINIEAGGSYNLEVTDASGCVSTQSIEVEANIELPSIELSISHPCGEGLGSATADISGGTGPYTIEWGNGQTGEMADDLITNVFYNVLVTDANGCSESQTFMVEVLAGIEGIEASTTEAACDQSNGSISLQIMGGTPPFSYEWNTGEVSRDLEDIAAGEYQVLVMDANGCSESQSIVVENLASIEGVEATAYEATCGKENGSISLQIMGGTPPFSYEWNIGDTNRDLENIAAGEYQVLVTDANGCTASQNIEVKATDSPVISIEVENASCNEANGRAVASVSGGTAPYTFSWDNGSTTAMAEDLVAGTYTLIITDASGCEVSQTAVISDEGAPDASFFVPFEFCIEDGDLTFVALQNAEGVFAVDGEAIEGNVWTPTMTGEISVTYTITENGCTSIEEQIVSLIDVFDADWTTAEDVFEVCVGDLPLTIISNNTSGHWIADINSDVLVATDMEGNKTITFTAELGDTDSGVFSVTHEGGGNNCGTSITKIITVHNLPQIPEITSDVTEVCGVENAPVLNLKGFPEFCNCPNTFNVYDSEGNLLQEGQTINEDVFKTADFIGESGIYTFEVASVNGSCESERSSVTIEVFEEVTANVTATASCDNESGQAVATVLNGVSPFVFDWNNGANTGIVTQLSPATYQVVVTDANGCTTEEDVTVEELILPVLDLGEDIVMNEGETVLLEVGDLENVTYFWSNGESSSSILVTESGLYSLTIITADGCEIMDEVMVTFVTDIAAIEGLNEWILYPNPANDFVSLQFDLQRNIAATVEILDMAGRQLFSENLQLSGTNKQFSIDTKDFPIGVYLVVLKGDNGMVTRKLVVE